VYFPSFSLLYGPKSQYFWQIFQVVAQRPIWFGWNILMENSVSFSVAMLSNIWAIWLGDNFWLAIYHRICESELQKRCSMRWDKLLKKVAKKCGIYSYFKRQIKITRSTWSTERIIDQSPEYTRFITVSNMAIRLEKRNCWRRWLIDSAGFSLL
jgi:hypothetical protein